MIYPAISLWQPFSSALFLEVRGERMKVHETRHWAAPERLIGQRVVVHAAKKRLPRSGFSNVVNAALTHELGSAWDRQLPYGAVIGTAVLESCKPISGGSFDGGALPEGGLDEHFGDWSHGRYAWRMGDPKLLDRPMEVTGRQGWFKVELP